MTASTQAPFHLKYRPRTLSEVIGHEVAVTTLQGYIKRDSFPSAIAFFGPTSSGKTTLARAFACSALGASTAGNPDYTEVNASSERSVDEVRALVQVAKLRPTGGKRRFIMLDEAQGLLGNPAAAAAVLTPVESPVSTTTWLIGSMDPERFASTSNGRALLTRCTQFHLTPPDRDALMGQLKRIRAGEKMSYLSREAAEHVLDNCQGQMRTLANMLEALHGYYSGLENPPASLGADAVQSVLSASASQDDATAVRVLVAVYNGAVAAAQRDLLNVSDGFGMVNKLLNMHWAVYNNLILKGARHPAVWMTVPARALAEQLASAFEKLGLDRSEQIRRMAQMHVSLTQLRVQSQAFAVPEVMALGAWAATNALTASR